MELRAAKKGHNKVDELNKMAMMHNKGKRAMSVGKQQQNDDEKCAPLQASSTEQIHAH